MNALLRIALSSLPLFASIVLGWDQLNQGFGQGAPYVGASLYGLLLGSMVIVMGGLPGLLLGGGASMLLAAALRLRPPAAVGVVADRWLTFAGPAVYIAVAWAAWAFMWHVDRPVATRDAPFGPSYFWTVGLVGAPLAMAFGAYAMHRVTRLVRPTPEARLSSPALY